MKKIGSQTKPAEDQGSQGQDQQGFNDHRNGVSAIGEGPPDDQHESPRHRLGEPAGGPRRGPARGGLSLSRAGGWEGGGGGGEVGESISPPKKRREGDK